MTEGGQDEGLARCVEEAGLNNLHSRRQLFYDGWVLFLSPGKAKRARSVNAQFASRLPLPEKIAHCERVYARQGLATLFRLTPLCEPRDLDDALAARGYVAFDETLVQTARLGGPGRRSAASGIELSAVPPDAFVEHVGALRGSPAGQRSAHLERLQGSPLDLVPIVARHGGVVVGAGMLSTDGCIAGVFDVVVPAALQRGGIGTALVTELLAKAVERGARDAYLQVSAANAPALALYRRFGFSTLYRYHYRAREAEVE
jgi:ribosomal protein S18 acetylase RimI-like enzyme